MAPMFDGHSYEGEAILTLPPDVAAHFQALHAMLRSSGLDAQALADCQAALNYLEEIYKNIVHFARTSFVEVGQVYRWTTGITAGFLRLAQARVPAALVVVAHFAAGTTAFRPVWYTENWGLSALRGIEKEIDERYLSWLEWPVEHGSQHMAVLGVVMPEDDLKRPLIGY